MVDIALLRKKLDEHIGQRNLIIKQLNTVGERLASAEQDKLYTEKARVVIQTVAEQTQKQIEYHISNLVSLALASVFPDPYDFKVQFTSRRNKTEADLLFVKNGNEGDPTSVSGGGPLDVASFALLSFIRTIIPTRPTLILDEPFRFVSRDLQYKCAEMVKMISRKLNVQIIMVSHIPELIENADKIIVVTKSSNFSEVM